MRNSTLNTAKHDLQALVREAQQVLREASTETGDKANMLIGKGIGLLDDTLAKAQDLQSAAIHSGREMVTTTDDYVHENPWRAIVISLSVGLLAGVCVSRCK